MPIGAFRLSQLVTSNPLGAFGLSKVLDNTNSYGTSLNDCFSYNAVSICESYAIVGAYGSSDASGGSAGSAYIYSTTTGNKLYTLDNPNAYGVSSGDVFGYSVAISNNYAIVGAYLEDDASGTDSGKAYIYSTSTGSLLYTLNNPNPYSTSTSDFFGYAVSISDSYAIVGAYQEDQSGYADSGKAYIYSTTGSLLYTLNNPNAYSTATNDNFGYSVAISNNYAIVGAYNEDDAGGASSGKAYIYSTSTGSLLYTLDNPNAYGTSGGDYFGYSVAISNNYAIVGAYFESDASGSNSGKAYIYSTSTGSLLYTLNNPNPYSTSSGDSFGISVGISNNYAIVGAYQEDDVGVSNSGKAYIYSTSTGSLLYTLNNPNAYYTGAIDQFGYAVSISDSYAISGAPYERDAGGTSSGKAYMYTRYLNQQISSPSPSGFMWIANNNSTTSTHAYPTSIQVGDIAIFAQTSTSTGDIIPTGFTSINGVFVAGQIRTNVSYKIITSGDIGGIISGMGGTVCNFLLICRDFSNPSPTITISSLSSQATAATPTTQTIAASNLKSIYFSVGATTSTGISTTFTPTVGSTYSSSSSLSNGTTIALASRFAVYDNGINTNPSGQSAVTCTMADGGTNTLQSFRVDVS